MAEVPNSQVQSPKPVSLEDLFGSEGAARLRQQAPAEPIPMASSPEPTPVASSPEPTPATPAPEPQGGVSLEDLFGSEGAARLRRAPGGIPIPSQLSLPMGTKEPPKPPAAMQGGVPASKKKVKTPSYVKKYMQLDEMGEPILYITRSPNQKTGVNVARHKAEIKRSLFKEDKERWEKSGKAWEDIPPILQEDMRKAAGRKADRLINSWIDEQRGTESIWIKGDPSYAENNLVDRAKSSMLWRAWAPIEATLFPDTVEVVEKSDLGKTYSQENKITTLDWLGRIAPSTIIFTAIKAGGYGNEEHIKELQAGKEAVSYISEIGDYLTDTAENMGLISKSTSDNWWLNAALGAGITIPFILAEPDLATPVIAAAGFLSGGPTGAAGGFLASKGAKGLKAIRPIARLNKTANQVNKFKGNLAEVAGGSARVKHAAAQKVINSSQHTSLGSVLKETSASRLATGDTSRDLYGQMDALEDTIQRARKAAPDTIEQVAKLDLDTLAAKAEGETPKGSNLEFIKLRKLTAGKELEVLEYAQARAMSDALLARDLQKRKIYAEGLSQFKPKLATPGEYNKITTKIQSQYDELADLERSINKSGITDAALAKRAKLIDEIQAEQKVIAKLNAQSGLQIAVKRAEIAQAAADKSRKLADVLTQVAVKSARMGDEAFKEGVTAVNKAYLANKKWLGSEKVSQDLDADMLYDTVMGALDDILESTDSLTKSLGVKATKYGVPELQDGLRALYGTDKIEEVITLFDKTFGDGKLKEFAANLGSDQFKEAFLTAEGLRTPIGADLYDELHQAMRSLVEGGIKSQKSDLGIELAEQVMETSDFITYMTNIQGVNWVERRMRNLARMADNIKTFGNPARKVFGSTSKAVVKVGRSMDSFFKRSANEIAEVLTSKIDETAEGATKEAFILDLGREAQEYAVKGALETPYVRELLVHLGMGDEGSESIRKAAVAAFIQAPNAKIYDKIVLGAYRQRNLKKLMTTTEPLKIYGGDTMSNVGKSSWWETSKSWWLRNIVEEAVEKGAQGATKEVGDKSLDAFVIAFLGKGHTEGEAALLVGGAKNKVLEKLQKDPDATYGDIEKVIIGSMTEGGERNISLDLTSKGLAHRAVALSNATSQERAVFDMLRRVGGVSEETAQGYKALKSGKESVNAEDFAGVLDLLRRYDLPVSREAYRNAEMTVSAALKVMGKLKGEGQRALIPTGVIEQAAKGLDNITKQLIQYDPTGDVSGKMSLNALTGLVSLWKSSLVTGLIAPNPGHFTNIFFGNFSQIAGEVGYGTATRVAAQTLHTFIPYFGKKVDDIMIRNMEKTGPNTTLGSIFNTVLNPHLSAFFNRSLAKDSDKIIGAGSKYAGTWGELREIAAANGVLSTFIGTDIRKALSKRMTSQLAESPSATKFTNAKKITEDILYGVPYKKFAETVEQRQRVALFMDLVMRKGMDPKEAAENVKKALYDWDAPLSDFETDWLNNLFLFWRFWKLSLGQAGRHLTDPFRAPIEKPTDLISYSMLQKTPLSRGISQARIAAAVPEVAFDKLKHDMEQQLESGEVTPEEYYMFLLSIKYPHWKKGGNKVFLANYPIDSQLSEQYQRVKGYAPTHEAITMPGLTLLDTYGMMLSMVSGLSAVAVTASRVAVGDEDVTSTDVIEKAAQTIIDPLRELGNPATELGVDELQDFFMGATPEYRAPYVRLKPSEKKMLEILNGSGFLSESAKRRKTDPEGVVRMNERAVKLFRMFPFLGTQIYRLADPALEASEREGLAEGIAHWVRQVSGLGKVYAHDPEYSISRSISDIGDKTKALKEESKYESITREDNVIIEDE